MDRKSPPQAADPAGAASRPLSTVAPQAGETLAEAAYRALRRDIIGGGLTAGARLRIERLSERYSVGPTPLREALQRLCADGLAETRGNRGFTVAPLDVAEFADLTIARTAIEKEALRLSIANGDDGWEAQIVAAAWRLGKADAALRDADDRALDGWERANAAFHDATVAACGSMWLLRMRRRLNDQCERYRGASVNLQRADRDLRAEHAELTTAVLARDADTACALIERHFATTASILAAGCQAAWEINPRMP